MLVDKNLNFAWFSLRQALKWSCSLCTYYFGWMSCLISFAWDQSTRQERVKGDKIQIEKFLSIVWLEPTTLRFPAWYSTDWATRALMKAVLLEWPLQKHVLPIQMYKFENVEVESILSSTCTVLCYTLEYRQISNLKRRKSPVLFSKCKTRPNIVLDLVEGLVVICMLKANTGLLRLFAICPIYM